jgi:hypothetical protein
MQAAAEAAHAKDTAVVSYLVAQRHICRIDPRFYPTIRVESKETVRRRSKQSLFCASDLYLLQEIGLDRFGPLGLDLPSFPLLALSLSSTGSRLTLALRKSPCLPTLRLP